jgi:uncharacterized membrane-anchored protein
VGAVFMHGVATWASWFANSAALRTGIAFAHVGGLVASAGPALVTDYAVLRASRRDAQARTSALRDLVARHRWVIAGLTVSGVMLLFADLESYLPSTAFWIKMAGVVLLAVNGSMMWHAMRAASAGRAAAWRTLRVAAVISIVLWMAITLLGTALPNVI